MRKTAWRRSAISGNLITKATGHKSADRPGTAGKTPFSEFEKGKETDGVPCGIFSCQFDISGTADPEDHPPKTAIAFRDTAHGIHSLRDPADVREDFDASATLSGEAAPGMSMKITGDTKVTMKGNAKQSGLTGLEKSPGARRFPV